MTLRNRTDTLDAATMHAVTTELRAVARRMTVARRSLEEVLPVELLHDPVLDMLLAMYQSDEPIRVDAIGVHTTVTLAVASRWLKVLESRKLIEIADGVAALSETGVARMNVMLATVLANQQELH